MEGGRGRMEGGRVRRREGEEEGGRGGEREITRERGEEGEWREGGEEGGRGGGRERRVGRVEGGRRGGRKRGREREGRRNNFVHLQQGSVLDHFSKPTCLPPLSSSTRSHSRHPKVLFTKGSGPAHPPRQAS